MALLSRMTRIFKPSTTPKPTPKRTKAASRQREAAPDPQKDSPTSRTVAAAVEPKPNGALHTPASVGLGSSGVSSEMASAVGQADRETARQTDGHTDGQQDGLDDHDAAGDAGAAPIALRRSAAADRRPPRNKQELFEELQKNYQQVVELVRKVDAHLDKQDERAERLTAIADRFDQSLPVLERSACETSSKLDELNKAIVETLRDGQRHSEERAGAIRSAVDAVGSSLERAGVEQLKLVSTMAAFRETVTDLARAHESSGRSMTDAAERVAARDGELAIRLEKLHRWCVLALIGLGVVAACVVTLTVVMLLRG